MTNLEAHRRIQAIRKLKDDTEKCGLPESEFKQGVHAGLEYALAMLENRTPQIISQKNTENLKINVMCRALTDIEFNGKFLKDGDVVAQECNMINDYTGKTSIELNRLLIQYNKRNGKWDVKCIDACVGHKNNFWGYIPRFTMLVGNVFDNPELLPREVVFEPRTCQIKKNY